jgi:hypothetical protein
MSHVLIRLADAVLLEVRNDGEGAVGCIVHTGGVAAASCGFDYAKCGLFAQVHALGAGFAGNLYCGGRTVGQIVFLPGRISGSLGGEFSWDTQIEETAYESLRALFAEAAK